MKIVSYPFIFWFMRNVDIKLLNNTACIINDKQYNYEPFNKYLFLFLKYTFPALVICFIYTKADFMLETKRLIELSLGFYLATTLALERILLFRIGLLIAICVCIFFLDPIISAFIAKYCLTLFIFYSFMQDLRIKVFTLRDENILVAHFTRRN